MQITNPASLYTRMVRIFGEQYVRAYIRYLYYSTGTQVALRYYERRN